ncbi:MAG: hypothetical protein E7330_01535 [Clostridiales bacterium]|nr:hypothetical protein [Clostridiales bacterium]
MADAFERMMKEIADEADKTVDYAAMREAIMGKAAAGKRRRQHFIRYGAMAATAVILAGAGGLFLASGSMKSADLAAPESVEMRYTESSLASGSTAESCAEEPAAAPVPEADTAQECAPMESAVPAASSVPEMVETEQDSGLNGAPLMPDGAIGVSGTEEEPLLFYSTDDLVDAWKLGVGPLAAFDTLLVPANWAEGYRLMEITVEEQGISYRCNKAAAEVHNDEYTVFIPDFFLREGAEPGEVQVLTEDGCSLDEAALEALHETEEIG